MPNGKYAECPHCGKIAYGEDEIEELFGYRGSQVQSWCRECRSSSSRSGCAYTQCQWQDEYPDCEGTIKCPLDDDN